MYYWPKEDPQYDPNKSRAENYKYLRGLFENDLKEGMIEFPDNIDKEWLMNVVKHILNNREFKGVHLDWNYTEMLRDLIDQGLVKVPISGIEVIFVEWAVGNLDNVKREFKYEKAWFDWDGKEWPGCWNEEKNGLTHWWNKRCDLGKEHHYNDSNREEYIPTPVMNVEQIPQQIEYGNHDEPNFIPWQEREHTAFWVTGVAE